MEDYQKYFQNFNEDISLALKGLLQSRIIKNEEFTILKLELEGKNDIAKELDKFIANIIVNYFF